jgi:hypothetical protein
LRALANGGASKLGGKPARLARGRQKRQGVFAVARKRKSARTQLTARVGTPEAYRGLLTRLNPEGLKALHQIALDRDTTAQALSIEALNDLFRKYGKRPVAKGPPGPTRRSR